MRANTAAQMKNLIGEMNEKMAGYRGARIAPYVASGATGVALLAALADLGMGDANALNSGELAVNPLIALTPAAGAMGGSLLGNTLGRMTPEQADAYVKEATEKAKAEVKGMTDKSPQEKIDYMADKKNAARTYVDPMRLGGAETKMTPRMMHGGRVGAAGGALLGLIPALQALQDE